MLLTVFGTVWIYIGFAHLTESRVLILRDFYDEPLILDHKEELNQEEPQKPQQPIIYNHTPKRARSSKKAIVQYGRHIYHLDNYEDMSELRYKLNQEPNIYDYANIRELVRSRDTAKNGINDYLKDVLVLSDTPLRFCYGRQCGDLRRSKKHKDNDETDWKHKKKQMPLGHMKRFQIVDNRHNSVRNPKSGSEEFHDKKKGRKRHKKKKNYSGSAESKNSEETEVKKEEFHDKKKGSKRHKKKKYSSGSRESKNSEETEDDSAAASFEKWKNHDENPNSEENIPKKKTKKKKKKIDASDDTKRKTIPIEETYFMQGNKIYHSFGKNKKKRDHFDKRRRLEHFMPKRYHWDPSDIHELGYYWFNGPRGMYPEPKTLSK